MLRLSQRSILRNTTSSTITKITRRSLYLNDVKKSCNVKIPSSTIAITLRQQHWKTNSGLLYNSKRLYNGGMPQGGFRLNPNQAQEQQKALEQYGIDLTAMAEKGKLDPVIGRDEEIRRTLEAWLDVQRTTQYLLVKQVLVKPLSLKDLLNVLSLMKFPNLFKESV
ncbi:Putative ATP-dependent Clp protease ATP-binding subunit ClpB [Rhizopus microsporus]|nr:Putative ATP-dependent Clp protease ATP-binding subunit ClpB [Rhizopus microsporus]